MAAVTARSSSAPGGRAGHARRRPHSRAMQEGKYTTRWARPFTTSWSGPVRAGRGRCGVQAGTAPPVNRCRPADSAATASSPRMGRAAAGSAKPSRAAASAPP